MALVTASVADAESVSEAASRAEVIRRVRELSFILVPPESENALAAGQRHQLGNGDAREITFHRGGEFGTTDYRLSEGTYEFHVGDEGWELRQ